MTMPRAAEEAKSFGDSPLEWTNKQIDKVLEALEKDLPGDPIGYILRAVPVSQRCDCGSLHLAVDAADLDDDTRSSLHRLLATPFGDVVREHVRREFDLPNVRFGWSGVAAVAPNFIRVVDAHDARSVHADTLSDEALDAIVAAIGEDLPGAQTMVDDSLWELSVNAVSPAPGAEGRREWKALIDQVMFAFSTPVRKYLEEYARRKFDGALLGAVNCCIVMSARTSPEDWSKRWFSEQVAQQLTPDC